MFGIVNFETFLLAGIILNITPGSDTMYILSRSISQGKKAGILSALGIASGALVHILFATLGLSVLLAKSAMAFTVLKYAGALYLTFLGIKTILPKKEEEFSIKEELQEANYKKIYLSGILTNVLNPKVALFFLAFLPQFIQEDHVTDSIPFLILGFTFLTTGTIWCLILALFASKLSHKIRQNYRLQKRLDKLRGGIFIAMGVKLALARR
ncbi:LysE family translocator [Flammeovirga sp. SJP92]|uniref:LysE family translocator n=1 Tax=Flammeovirga sp. SJP92 TaxID=1775430 RepID=UPI000787ACFA|nr:LysE family translocator [Flammeovirga sp. SJP92]KXX67056.1 homoserine lactone transporter [Flammeovirga sp. SJP92]